MPAGDALDEHFIKQPTDPYRGYAIKWDGEWQITYDVPRHGYAVGSILIYLFVVAHPVRI